MFRLFLPNSDYPTNEGVVDSYQRLEERMQALPGVLSATVTSNIPMRSTLDANDFQIEGWVAGPDTPPLNVDYQKAITPNFFETLDFPIAPEFDRAGVCLSQNGCGPGYGWKPAGSDSDGSELRRIH